MTKSRIATYHHSRTGTATFTRSKTTFNVDDDENDNDQMTTMNRSTDFIYHTMWPRLMNYPDKIHHAGNTKSYDHIQTYTVAYQNE